MTISKFTFLCTAEPIDEDLMNDVAAVIPAKWYGFGVQLKIEPGILDGFKQQNMGDCLNCFSAVFTKWKSSPTRTPICWATVVKVLKSPHIDEQDLAKKIIAKHNLSL